MIHNKKSHDNINMGASRIATLIFFIVIVVMNVSQTNADFSTKHFHPSNKLKEMQLLNASPLLHQDSSSTRSLQQTSPPSSVSIMLENQEI